MVLTTIAFGIISQVIPGPGGNLPNPQINNPTFPFQNPHIPSGIKFRDLCTLGERWTGVTEDGQIIGTCPSANGAVNSLPSDLNFVNVTGILDLAGAGLCDDGRVFWWSFESNTLETGFTSETYSKVEWNWNYDGVSYVVGLKTDGTIEYLGPPNIVSTLSAPPVGHDFIDIATSPYGVTAGISSQGCLKIWGENNDEELDGYDGQIFDWEKIISYRGFGLMGLTSSGTTDVIPDGYPNALQGESGLIDIAAPFGQSPAFGLRSDGSIIGKEIGSSNTPTYTLPAGSVSSIKSSTNIISVVLSDHPNSVTRDPSNLDQYYSYGTKIELSPGTYEIDDQVLNDHPNVHLVGSDRDNCVVNLLEAGSEQYLSIENCTVQVANLEYLTHMYFTNCHITIQGSFTQGTDVTKNNLALFRNCSIINSSSPVVKSSGNTQFIGCDISTGSTVYSGSGSIKLTNCDVPAFANFGISSLIDVKRKNPSTLKEQAFIDLAGTEITGADGIIGPIIQCREQFTLQIYNANCTSCSAVQGGSFWFDDATVKIAKSNFDSGFAQSGCDIYAQGSFVEIEDCSFTNSQSDGGEPIYAAYSTLDVNESFFGSHDQTWDITSSIVLVSDSYFCDSPADFSDPFVIDLGGNSEADDCQDFDCNLNGILDDEEVESGNAADCNQNGIPDSCDLDTAFESDCNSNQIPDSCEIADGLLDDCDTDGVPDVCTILDSPSQDSNNDGILDRCQCITDINGDGFTDFSDVLQLLSCWGSDPTGVCGFADVSDDGIIDFSDVLLMLNDFGPC